MGLDLKCTNNFNKMVVSDYFAKQQWLNEKYNGIPPEQDWNMDEKGCQNLGVGIRITKHAFFLQSRPRIAIISRVITWNSQQLLNVYQ